MRVVPADPGQALAVGRRRREREEVGAGDQLPDRRRVVSGGPVERHGRDGAGDLAARVQFLDAPDLALVRGEGEVGEAHRTRTGADVGLDRIRGQRVWLLLARGGLRPGHVQPLVGVVREHDRVAARRTATGGRRPGGGAGDGEVGQATVLVHAGAGVPRRGQQVGLLASGAAVHHGDPATFVRPSFLPPHLTIDHGRECNSQPPRATSTAEMGDGHSPKGIAGPAAVIPVALPALSVPSAAASAVPALFVIGIWCTTGMPGLLQMPDMGGAQPGNIGGCRGGCLIVRS